MKTIHIKKWKVITTVCLALVLLCTMHSFGGLTAYAQESDKQARIISEIAAYDSTEARERLYTLTESHVSLNMDDGLTIQTAKSMVDFDGNTYTLFELSPTGYIVYHDDSGKYVEYSSTGISPYLNRSSELYYGGAMQYYYKDGLTLYHTLKDLAIPTEEIEILAVGSNQIAQALSANVETDNLAFVNGQTATANAAAVSVNKVATQAQTRAAARITMPTFFTNLNTSIRMGYKDDGVCGYIATAMIIAYNYFAYDYGLISNSSYINSTNKTLNGSGLTNRLLELNGEDPSQSSFAGTTGATFLPVMTSYFKEVSNYGSWKWGWRVLAIDAVSTINAGHPVILFGSLPDVSAVGNVNHAVVAYQTAKYGLFNMFTKYRVHYGWPGYQDVWLESPVVGTIFFMKMI